jgi:hypothetical protein
MNIIMVTVLHKTHGSRARGCYHLPPDSVKLLIAQRKVIETNLGLPWNICNGIYMQFNADCEMLICWYSKLNITNRIGCELKFTFKDLSWQPAMTNGTSFCSFFRSHLELYCPIIHKAYSLNIFKGSMHVKRIIKISYCFHRIVELQIKKYM